MELFILLGLLVILAGIRYELRALRVARRRRRQREVRRRAALGLPAAAVLMALLATGCASKATKPDLPGEVLVKPTIVYVDRYVYVPIKAELTRTETIAEGPLSQCPAVAANRKAALKRAYAQLVQISQIQGTEAQP